MNWYYVDAAGQQAGPLDDAGLDAMLASGKLNGESLVWSEGMANWQPAREVRPSAVAAGPAPAVASGIEEAVCAECGGIFPVNDTIRIGNARVCARCKPIFVQKMQEGLSVENPGAWRYAGFWIRAAAIIIDMLVIWAFVFAMLIVMGGMFAATKGNPASAVVMFLLLYLLMFVGVISYETFFVGKYGATLGKMALKIKVITADGTQVSYLRALGRHFSKMLSAIFAIGFIMAGFDIEKRALHDRICNTRVVHK